MAEPLAITLETISLPTSLTWVDEYNWSPVNQFTRRTLSGILVVYHATNVRGRPITLQSTEESGWTTLATVQSIQALSEVPGAVYVLTIGSQSFQVMFRHEEPPAFVAEPIVARLNYAASDYARIKISLFTV